MGAFGAFAKRLRAKKGMTLRQFCLRNGFDPGNYSRMERGRLAPPQSRKKLEEYAGALGVEQGTDEWYEFFDLAAAERGHIPDDLLADEELVSKLPLFFRTLRGRPVTKEQLDDLIDLVRKG